VRVDPASHVPIYLQIVAELRSAIAGGVFRPGEMLPSQRTLALRLRVNPNTVQRALEELVRQGLAVSRRGVGLFVAARGARSARDSAESHVEALLGDAVRAALAAGIPPTRVHTLLNERLAEQSAAETPT
jgi:GntR family transcriptional regulator